MIKEKSCGCIIENNNQVLIIKQSNGDWGFPKGHVEEDESEIETALREVKEETNLDVSIVSDKRHKMEYYIDRGIFKEVILFLAHPITSNLKKQDGEIDDVRWLNIDDALNLLTFDNSKNALKDLLNIER